MAAPTYRKVTPPPERKPGHGLRPRSVCLALAAALSTQVHAAPDLTSLSLEQLLEVTIVGASKYQQKQGEVAAAVSVITWQEIKAFGWRTIDEALASLPGVYTTYDRQSVHFGARGFGLPGDFNTRMLVTVNGNRVNAPTYDSGLFGHDFPVDMDLIERIEFIPGPGGAVYGQNAMFGVVNVITRTGADIGGGEVAMVYQHPQAQAEGRASWGNVLDNGVDLQVSVSGLHARGEDRFFDYGASGVSGVAAGMDGERGRKLFARIARGAWSFEHVYGWSSKDDPTGSFFSTPLVPGQSQAVNSALTQLQFEDSFGADSLHVRARLFMGTTDVLETVSLFGEFFETRGQTKWRGAELNLLYTALPGHKLMVGVEGQDTLVADQSEHGLVDTAHDFRIQSPGYRIGVYAQDEWRIADAVSATFGMRADRNNVTGTSTSPRAALIWRATPATTVKALYGRAHRAPNAFERDYDDGYSQIGNPALKGERIDTLELVADHRIAPDLALRGSVYQWSIRDLITLGIDPARGLPQYQSGEEVNARGLELSADKTWVSGARLRGSVSVQDVSYVDGRDLFNSPKLLGKLNLSGPLPWGGLRAGYELRYDGKRLSLDGTRLGGYVLSNLTLSTDRLPKGVELSVSLLNLFDKYYAQPAAQNNWQNAFQQDGRSVRVNLGFGF